jgi:hypothetical protein
MDTYYLPFTKGTRVWVTQGNNSPFSHTGKAAFAFDFGLTENPVGAPLVASAGGVVDMFEDSHPNNSDRSNYLVIRHNDGFCDSYLHLTHGSVREFGLTVGSTVARGQTICRMGETGRVTGPHLHFQRQHCGPTYWQQSVPVSFADCTEVDKIPKEGRSYVSQNEMGPPVSVKSALEGIAAQRNTALLLGPAGVLLNVAQQDGLGLPLAEIAQLRAPDSTFSYVQIFEGDTLYLGMDADAAPANVGRMSALLIQDPDDAWGLTLWRHTYAKAGLVYRPTWASHQFVLGELATNPLGAPLGGGSVNGVHILTVGGQRYEAEVYARDTIYWAPPNWSTILRLSELDD